MYLAHDTTLDREVAFALIKSEGLDDTSRERIQREAQAMGRLGSHPHIVTVFDLGQEPSTSSSQDQPYMVTELMGGGGVEGLIENADGHRLSVERAISIAAETCRGLEFAHRRGIVHRDLKPGNVWLTSDGVAKIGDFGLAVALDRSRLTTEGTMVGTVSYMPPEQAMGGEVTPRSDLYSLGAMLYEMVTGRPPYLGENSVGKGGGLGEDDSGWPSSGASLVGSELPPPTDRDVPHWPQNRKAGGLSKPQEAQWAISAEPQPPQNFISGEFSWPHWEQVTLLTPCCPGRDLNRFLNGRPPVKITPAGLCPAGPLWHRAGAL